jgi:hypothetical protein
MRDPKRVLEGIALIISAILVAVAGSSLHMAISPWEAFIKFSLVIGACIAVAVFVSWRGEDVEAEIIDPKTGEITKVEACVHRCVGDILSDLPPPTDKK